MPTIVSDPVAEHDALVLMCSAVFIGCRPLLGQLPELNQKVLAAALSRSFEVLGFDRNDESLARSQLTTALREVESRRNVIASGEIPIRIAN